MHPSASSRSQRFRRHEGGGGTGRSVFVCDADAVFGSVLTTRVQEEPSDGNRKDTIQASRPGRNTQPNRNNEKSSCPKTHAHPDRHKLFIMLKVCQISFCFQLTGSRTNPPPSVPLPQNNKTLCVSVFGYKYCSHLAFFLLDQCARY